MSVDTVLRIAFWGCIAAFLAAFWVAATFPSLVWPAATVALIVGVAAGPISEAIGKRTRG